MSLRARRLWLVLLCSSALSFTAACGSDDDDRGSDDVTDLDAGHDVDDNGGDTDDGDTTGDAGDGDDGDDGGDDLLPCRQPRQECEDPSQSTDNYICETELGLCLTRCDAYGDDYEDGQCGPGSICLELQGGPEIEGVMEPGACVPGDCDGTFFSHSCGADANCLPVGNGASFCLDAGPREEGQSCGESQACMAGLFCVGGTCEAACDSTLGADACDDDLSCLPAVSQTGQNRPGLCRQACDDFSAGQCDEGFACQPYGRNSITAWGCEANEGTVVGDGEPCGGDDVACEEGTICVNQGTEDAPDARCLAYCATGSSSGENASCGDQPEPTFEEIELIGDTAFGELSAYFAFEAAEIDFSAFGGDDLLFEDSQEFEEGEFGTFFIYDGADGAAFAYASDDADFDGEAGFRAFIAAPGFDALSFGRATQLYSSSAAPSDVATPGDLEGRMFYELGGEFTFLANEAGAEDLSFFFFGDDSFEATGNRRELSDEDNGLRFFSAFGDAVDFYLGCEPDGEDDPSFADCDGIGPLFAAASGFDGLSEYKAAFASYAYIVPAGADPADFEGEPLFGEILDLRTDELYTFALLEDEEGSFYHKLYEDELLDELYEDEFTLRFYNFSGKEFGLYRYETLAADLASGEFSSEDGAFEELAEGFESFFFFNEDGIFGLEAFEINGGFNHSFIFAADGDDVGFFGYDAEGSPELEDGEAAFAIFNASAANAAVRFSQLEEGEVADDSGMACVPSNFGGLGFCRESCEPYPRRDSYECDNEYAACIPFNATTDGSSPNTGYCVDREAADRPANGEACDTPGAFDACDDGLCLGVTEDRDECLGFCEIFSQGQCEGEAVCLGGLLMNGIDDFAICLELEDGNNVGRGNACTEAQAGAFCGDFAVCLQTTQTDYGCVPLCRSTPGFSDCDAGQTCMNVASQIPGAPSYLGICN